MKKNGFTMIELIAVISVLAIIVVLVAPSLLNSSVGSKQKLREAKIETINYAAGNLVEDNVDEYSVCNSGSSEDTLKNNCILPIESLIEKNYLDLDENEKNEKIVIDPVTNAAFTGKVYVCYNMKTGLFSTKYVEDSAEIDQLCANTGIHTLALQDNSVAIAWHENKTFTTNIFTTGEFNKIELSNNPNDNAYGVKFEIVNKQLKVVYNKSTNVNQNTLKDPIKAVVRGTYNIINNDGSSNSETYIETTFNVYLYDEVTEKADTLFVTIKPSNLLKNVTDFDNDITLTCIQKNDYGCMINVEDIITYTGVTGDSLRSKGYYYIDQYSLNAPVEKYYEAGSAQNGTHSSSAYRIYKDQDYSTDSKKSLKTGSVLYIGIKPREFTVSFDANGGSVSKNAKQVVYSENYNQSPQIKNNINSLTTESLPIPVREGYIFLGWYTAKTGGTKITNSSVVNILSNQTLYAHWEIIKYNISLDITGATTTTASLTVNHGSNATYTVVADRTHKLNGATVSCTNGLSNSINTNTGVISFNNVTTNSTCSVVLPVAYTCSVGTLKEDASRGFICVTSASSYPDPYPCNCTYPECNCRNVKTCTDYKECEDVETCTNNKTCTNNPVCTDKKICTNVPICKEVETCEKVYYKEIQITCVEDCVSRCQNENKDWCASMCESKMCVNQWRTECTTEEVCTSNEVCSTEEVCTSNEVCSTEEVCSTDEVCNTGETCTTERVCDTCKTCDTCYETVYSCDSGWSTYSGSGFSLKCYKAATIN